MEQAETQRVAARAMVQPNRTPFSFGVFVPSYSDPQLCIWEALGVRITKVIWFSEGLMSSPGGEGEVKLRPRVRDVTPGWRDLVQGTKFPFSLTKPEHCFQPQALCASEILEADFDTRGKRFSVLKQNTLHHISFLQCWNDMPWFHRLLQEPSNTKQLFLHFKQTEMFTVQEMWQAKVPERPLFTLSQVIKPRTY